VNDSPAQARRPPGAPLLQGHPAPRSILNFRVITRFPPARQTKIGPPPARPARHPSASPHELELPAKRGACPGETMFRRHPRADGQSTPPAGQLAGPRHIDRPRVSSFVASKGPPSHGVAFSTHEQTPSQLPPLTNPAAAAPRRPAALSLLPALTPCAQPRPSEQDKRDAAPNKQKTVQLGDGVPATRAMSLWREATKNFDRAALRLLARPLTAPDVHRSCPLRMLFAAQMHAPLT